ncbi:hypothetical protein [Xanthomonas bonasiae]|nr:hypothetical protein [Xanthomonas bonasiae]MBN6112403.1 hypothetical protein [Xanthomonas bonasiae]
MKKSTHLTAAVFFVLLALAMIGIRSYGVAVCFFLLGLGHSISGIKSER